MPAFLRRTVAFVLGCGCLLSLSCRPSDSSGEAAPERLVVVLDYLPGPIHAGLYAALARGDYAAAGLAVELHAPSATSDTIRLMASGQADLGLIPVLDLFTQHDQGRPGRLLLALVQSPLSAVITPASPEIRTARDLIGKTVATTGLPGDDLILDAMVRADGGDPARVERIELGFNTIQALTAGRVDAAFGFWNAEGLQYAQDHAAHLLRTDQSGLPNYPEIVFFTSQDRLDAKGAAIERFLEVTRASYIRLLAEPEEALAHFAAAVDGYSVDSARPYLEALLPVFQGEAALYGDLDPVTLDATLAWLFEAGFISRRFPASELLSPDFSLAAE